MAKVEIRLNGRDYKVTCDDGQEKRLHELAAFFDRRVAEIADDVGQVGDARLMLLGALTVCDELFETKKRAGALETAGDALGPETVGGAARAVEAAVKRVNAISARIN